MGLGRLSSFPVWLPLFSGQSEQGHGVEGIGGTDCLVPRPRAWRVCIQLDVVHRERELLQDCGIRTAAASPQINLYLTGDRVEAEIGVSTKFWCLSDLSHLPAELMGAVGASPAACSVATPLRSTSRKFCAPS